MYAFDGIAEGEISTVPDGSGPTIALLTPHRRLPKSATNIAIRERQWLESYLQVRFDAPIADARSFAAEMLKGKSASCSWRPSTLEGWPEKLPSGASCGQDDEYRHEKSDILPPISVAIIPKGSRATVLVDTSS